MTVCAYKLSKSLDVGMCNENNVIYGRKRVHVSNFSTSFIYIVCSMPFIKGIDTPFYINII